MPAKLRFSNECYDKIFCDRCNNQVYESKEFEANLHLKKRQTPNVFGHTLPYLKY